MRQEESCGPNDQRVQAPRIVKTMALFIMIKLKMKGLPPDDWNHHGDATLLCVFIWNTDRGNFRVYYLYIAIV